MSCPRPRFGGERFSIPPQGKPIAPGKVLRFPYKYPDARPLIARKSHACDRFDGVEIASRGRGNTRDRLTIKKPYIPPTSAQF
ncbi:hypothetical protein [Phormidium sp. CCY1219]|uniref:hypothetical protein n=1 Tax=Phormidium sp. CCY1219 TaxID=2886104 RepID=UPI002D1F350E|nr:hypothetical protein [Phormidium sp. CCY1219]MEB3829997.1 hypothetical protein [Phormidium sp. CCY1219]